MDAGATWFEVNDQRVGGPPAFSPDYSRDRTLVIPDPFNSKLYLSQDDGRTLALVWGNRDTAYEGWGSVVAWGVRRQDPPGEPPTPPTPLPGARHYYLPLMISSPPSLEFWLVAQEAASSDCYLYRSRDAGASWQEINVP